MSETLCTLRTKGGGGGKYTETSLWTNPSPTSSFASQSVALSDSISNYKYIKITCRLSTSDARTNSTICLVSDLVSYNTGTNKGFWLGLGGNPVDSQGWVRNVTYVSDTSLTITGGKRVQANASDTSYLIPLEILGLNELDHGKNFDETVLWTNNAPTTARSGTNTITLSESYQNYDFVKITYNYTTTDIAPNYMSILVAPKDLYGVNGRPAIALSRTNASGNYVQVRHISSNSYTTITDTLDVSAQSTSCIIINIVGCKFR